MSSFTAPTPDAITQDLVEKPMWILSSYGPGKNPPCQLIEGKDVSFEEARLLAYKCQADGNPAAYVRCSHPDRSARIELADSESRSKSGSDSTRRPIRRFKTSSTMSAELSPSSTRPRPTGRRFISTDSPATRTPSPPPSPRYVTSRPAPWPRSLKPVS